MRQINVGDHVWWNSYRDQEENGEVIGIHKDSAWIKVSDTDYVTRVISTLCASKPPLVPTDDDRIRKIVQEELNKKRRWPLRR